MSKARLTEDTIIVSGEAKAVEATHYYVQVGRALTTWAVTENKLSEYYCMLVCGRNTPSDGAITTFSELSSFDSRHNLISKCLDQVLYPDKFNDFRKAQKKKLNRIKTLSQIRNKIAHGATIEQEDTDRFLFYPYFMHAADYRQRGLTELYGSHPSAVKRPIKWDLQELVRNVKSLQEAVQLADELVTELTRQYEENLQLLRRTTRMLLRPGLPFQRRPGDHS